jgi:hypothetical protein
MSFTLPGTPSDQLPAVLATGRTDINTIFVSMAAREPAGRDADYLAWHSLDHRPEQYRIAGIRHSLRLVSTPACRALRACSAGRFDAVDHVMTYFFTADAAFEQFNQLSAALGGERRPFRLPTVEAGYLRLAGMVASPHAIAGADVMPWRPARGVYLLVEEMLSAQGSPDALSPTALAGLPGVAGIWWHRGGVPPLSGFRDNSGLLLTYCFLDEDPLQVAGQMFDPLRARWAGGAVRPLLAAPFQLPVPFEWDRHLP